MTKSAEPFPHEFREDTMPHPAVSPDGEILVTRSKLDHVQFWNLKTSKPIAPATAVRDIVFNMEFSADGKWLFSHDESGDLNVWDPTTGKQAAGPFRHDSRYPALRCQKLFSEIATTRDGRERQAKKTPSGRAKRSSVRAKIWGVVHRVKMDGLIRKVKWLDDTHLLIVSEEKPKLDDRGRPTAAGRISFTLRR